MYILLYTYSLPSCACMPDSMWFELATFSNHGLGISLPFLFPTLPNIARLFSPGPHTLNYTSFALYLLVFFFILKHFEIYREVARIFGETLIYPLTTFTILLVLLHLKNNLCVYVCICVHIDSYIWLIFFKSFEIRSHSSCFFTPWCLITV